MYPSSLTLAQVEAQCDKSLPELLIEFYGHWCTTHERLIAQLTKDFRTAFSKEEIIELLSQVMFNQVLRFRAQGARAPRSPWPAYLIVVCRNHFRTELRKQQPQRTYRERELLQDATSALAYLDPMQLDPDKVMALMAGKLSPLQEKVLWMYLKEEKDHVEIAAELGKTVNNVKSLKNLGLNKVRRLLVELNIHLPPRRTQVPAGPRHKSRSRARKQGSMINSAVADH